MGHRQTRRGCRPAVRQAGAVAGWVGLCPLLRRQAGESLAFSGVLRRSRMPPERASAEGGTENRGKRGSGGLRIPKKTVNGRKRAAK